MKKSLIILGIVVGVIVISIFSIYSYVNSVRNTCIAHENELISLVKIFKVEDAAFNNTIRTQAQLVGMSFTDAQIAVVTESVKKYSYNQDLMFQMINEGTGITLDPALWVNFQNAIESGYTNWVAKQKAVISRARVYQDYLEMGLIRSGLVRSLGFPNKDEAQFAMRMVITSEETEEMMESGTKEAIDLFGDK